MEDCNYITRLRSGKLYLTHPNNTNLYLKKIPNYCELPKHELNNSCLLFFINKFLLKISIFANPDKLLIRISSIRPD